MLVAGLAVQAMLGCASTTMSAADARVPVLLGPIPCIGCTAGSAETSAPASMVARSSARHYVCLLCPGSINSLESTSFTSEADHLGVAACGGSLALSELQVETWTLSVPPFVLAHERTIDGEVRPVRMKSPACPRDP